MRQYQEVQQEKPQTETQTDKETCQTSIKLDKQFEKKTFEIKLFQITRWFEFSIYVFCYYTKVQIWKQKFQILTPEGKELQRLF